MKFIDDQVIAVAGNPRVSNITNLITIFQANEYHVGFPFEHRPFSELGCLQVISGGIGAFRTEILKEMGGYSLDTITEDFDLTIALAKDNRRVVFAPKAIAYTEAPSSLKDFIKQRYRW